MDNLAWNVLRIAQSSNVDAKAVGAPIAFAAVGYLINRLFRKTHDPKTLEETFVDPVDALDRNVVICNAFEKLQRYRNINPSQFQFMITSIDHIMLIERQLANKVIIGTLDDIDAMMILIDLIRDSMNRFLYSAIHVARLNRKTLRLVRSAIQDIIKQLPNFTLSIENMCYRYNEQDILKNAEKDVNIALRRARQRQNNF